MWCRTTQPREQREKLIISWRGRGVDEEERSRWMRTREKKS